MSIFKKIFGGEDQQNKPQSDPSKFVKLEKEDFHTFQELFEQHAGLSFEKQLIFADVIGNSGWELDMDKESIYFGTLELPIQIIGSLAYNNNSWMWGWANTQSQMPENLLNQSKQLKDIGIQKNIKELTDGHYTVEEGFEHKVGMIACGLFNSKSYYCADYGQGTLVVTIDDEKIPAVEKNRFEKIFSTFPQLLSAIQLNHKNALKNYLIDRDFELNITATTIEGLKNNKTLIAEFDELERMESLNAKI